MTYNVSTVEWDVEPLHYYFLYIVLNFQVDLTGFQREGSANVGGKLKQQ